MLQALRANFLAKLDLTQLITKVNKPIVDNMRIQILISTVFKISIKKAS